MTALAARAAPETPELARLRQALHDAGVAARIGLLAYASEVALATMAPGRARDEGRRDLMLAETLAGGGEVDPQTIIDALHDEQDAGLMINQQLAPQERE